MSPCLSRSALGDKIFNYYGGKKAIHFDIPTVFSTITNIYRHANNKSTEKKINNNNNNFLGLTDSVGSDVWAVHLRPIGWKRCKYNARNPTKERKFYTFFSSEIAKKKKNM